MRLHIVLILAIMSHARNVSCSETYQYTVVKGDTLSDIAFLKMGTPIFTEGGSLDRLLELNPTFNRFTKLIPGTRLTISFRRTARSGRRKTCTQTEEESEQMTEDIYSEITESAYPPEVEFYPDLKINWGIGYYSLDQTLQDSGEHLNMWGTTFNSVQLSSLFKISEKYKFLLNIHLFSYNNNLNQFDDYYIIGTRISVINPSIGILRHLLSLDHTEFNLLASLLLESSPYFYFVSNTALEFKSSLNLAPSVKILYRSRIRESVNHISSINLGIGFETIAANLNSDVSLIGFPHKEIFLISIDHQFLKRVAFTGGIDIEFKNWSWVTLDEKWSQRYLNFGFRIGLAFKL